MAIYPAPSALSNIRRRGYGLTVPGQIQSIERAAAVLRVLGTGTGQLRLTEISAALGLPKGTAHGIVRTLTEVGFVDQDRASGRYRLGARLSELHAGYLDANELRARSMNWADPLAARTGEAVRVCVPSGTDVLVVHSVFRPDGSPQRSEVGALLPAHATALGKVLLAHLPALLQQLPVRLAPHTPRTPRSRDQLSRELARVREQGVGVEFGEHLPGRAALAAPVFGPGGLAVAAVGVHGDLDRICDTSGAPWPAMVGFVIECGRAVTRELATED